MIINALINHLSGKLDAARPQLKFTERQLITSFKNSFDNINESSVCPVRAKECHETYVTRIINESIKK